MKIVRYVDIYPGCLPENVYLFKEAGARKRLEETKRYRIEFEIPDFPYPVDGEAENMKVTETKEG